MTNHGRIALVDDFYQACKGENINPIIGCEFYVAHGKYDDKTPENKDRWHITVLAKNNQGVKNLYHLSYLMNKNGFYYKPRIDDDLLFKYKEGLIVLSGCAGSEINSHLRRDEGYEYDFEKAVEVARKFKEQFGEDYYIELQDHPMRSTGKQWPIQDSLNKDLTKIAKMLNIKRVLTADCHYANSNDHEAHEVLLCIGTGKYLSDSDRMSLDEFDLSLKSPEVLYERWKDDTEVLENTLEINDKVHIEFNLEEQAMPEFNVPDGMSMIQYLKLLTYRGAVKRFLKEDDEFSISECYNKLIPLNKNFHGQNFTGIDILERIEMELGIVNKIGVPGYFLIVQEYINWAKNNGIRVGCGRGSSLASLMCYCLRITEVNPLGISGFMFERFLNPDRISLPDVDTDFEARYRDKVIQHFKDIYGEDHVVGIGVQSTMRSKNAVRDVARVLEYPFDKSLELTKLLPDAEHTGAPKLKEYIASDEELQKLYNNPEQKCETPEFRERYNTEPEVKRIVDIAIKLEGKQRNHGIHACGTVISPEPIWNYFPTEISNDVMATTVPMHSVELGGVNEKGGLLKIDVLGLSTLDLISDTLSLIKKTKGIDVDIDNVDLEDEETLRAYREGRCKDTFTFSCISGDVKIVTNKGFAKISELYKCKSQKTTVSVDLANGVRKCRNKIKKIVKTGIKDTYLIETENNSALCATKEHYFFTKSGWKQLKDITTKDSVLVAPYKIAKGTTIKCPKCGNRRISYNGGSRNGKLCRSCGSWTKNPKYKHLLEEFAKKSSERQKGHSLQENIHKTDEEYANLIKKLSKRMSGEGNPMFGKTTHTHGKFREDLGHYVRSSWEADYARMLKYENIEYIYEWKRFELVRKDGSKLTYLPDFYIPSTNTIVEVKGLMRPLDQEKIDLFKEQYHQFNFELVRQNEIAEIEFKYKDKIIFDCPKIPDGFKFEKVKEISFWKTEETYDMMMEGPFHNYIAGGFVVHNSGGMQETLKGLKVDKFSDLVLVNAMYRPGAMDYIKDAIDVKNGVKKPYYWFNREKLLEETYGIIAYQEQGMEIAKFMGFTGGETDNMRKALAKKNKGFLDAIFPTFKEKAIKKGFSEQEVDKYWDSLIGFSRYSFNKAHAYAYAVLGYQTGYLKTHYPSEYYAAYFNHVAGDKEKLGKAIKNAKEIGINVLPPDAEKSDVNFTVDDNGNILYGFSAIKGVGKSSEIILERRKEKEINSVKDFFTMFENNELNVRKMEMLAKAGVLDNICKKDPLIKSRSRLLFNFEEIYEKYKTKKNVKRKQQALFEIENDEPRILEPLPKYKIQTLQYEKEVLGTYVSKHPLDYASEIEDENWEDVCNSQQDLENKTKKTVKCLGTIESCKVITTKKGQKMCFMTLLGKNISFDVTVFPSTFEKYKDILKIGNSLFMTNYVDDYNENDRRYKYIMHEAKRVLEI